MNKFTEKRNLLCTYTQRTQSLKNKPHKKIYKWSVNEKLPVILLMKQTTDCMTPYQINYHFFHLFCGCCWLPEVMTGLIYRGVQTIRIWTAMNIGHSMNICVTQKTLDYRKMLWYEVKKIKIRNQHMVKWNIIMIYRFTCGLNDVGAIIINGIHFCRKNWSQWINHTNIFNRCYNRISDKSHENSLCDLIL